jgi:hypothetical protein
VKKNVGPSSPVHVVEPVYIILANPASPTQPLLTDALILALAVIDSVHHEVHEGNMFHTEYSASVNNNNNLDVQITTGANGAHMTALVAVGGQCLLYLYEAPTTTVGTALTVYNMKRSDTVHVAPFTAVHTPNVGDVGIVPLINGRLIPGGATNQTRIGGEGRPNTEWLLAPNTKYLFRVNNNSGGAIIIHVTIEAYTP